MQGILLFQENCYSFSSFDPMFYVEHMKTVIKNILFSVLSVFVALVLIFGLMGCNKKDPNPELSDEIYKDLVSELDIAKKRVADEENQYARVKKEFEIVVPQTGQIKYAQKRVFESEQNLNSYKQQAKYFEIKLEQRKIFVRERYLESFLKDGRQWPDEEEIKDYRLRLKLQRAKLDWNKKDKPAESSTAKSSTTSGGGH